MMNICIVGTGRVGCVLGRRWAKEGGHKVFFGTRNPHDHKHESLKDIVESISVMDIHGAIHSAEIIVLAVPYKSVENVVKQYDAWAQKIIIDCTNPLNDSLDGFIDVTGSAAEMISRWTNGASVVKAFNCIGTSVMENPSFGNEKAMMYICGDDAPAKNLVKRLSEELGFEVLDCGGLSMSAQLEHIALLWIQLALKQGLGTDFAFKLLRR
ncbi:MAG: NADPH-dependent F420 reductase [Candidatus Omnitrophica bacterium]|nr:NADPH-dependent F420 reductase [Candidatus Omnitrophota bacterium]